MGKKSTKSDNVRACVYGLLCCDGSLRYIGKTKLVLSERLEQHCKDKKRTYKGFWIRSLIRSGKRPAIFLIEECKSEEDALEAEKFYIRYFRFLGCNLTNGTEGGEGVVNPTAQTRLNMSLAHRGKKLGKNSEDHRRKIAEGNRGKRHSEETKQKISLSKAGTQPWNAGKSGYKIKLTEVGKVRKSESARNRRLSVESRKKISDKARGRKLQPLSEVQKKNLSEKLRGRVFSEEHRRNLSEAKRKKDLMRKETPDSLRARADFIESQEAASQTALLDFQERSRKYYTVVFHDSKNVDLERSFEPHRWKYDAKELEFLGIGCKHCEKWIRFQIEQFSHGENCPVLEVENLLKERESK